MPQSLAQVWLHFVWSVKERRPLLQDETFRTEMFKMLSHHITQQKCVSASVGGHVDHVHALIGLSRTITIAKLVEHLKTETTKWAKQHEHGSSAFSWQAGYGVFSVSHSARGDVDHYIRNQAQHHTKFSYKDEFRLFCKKHGIEIDERYVWD